MNLSRQGRLYLDLLRHTLCRDRLPDAGYEMAGGPAVLKPFNPPMREEGRDWPSEAMTMVGEKRLINLEECCVRALEENIPGDFVETGVWRGGCGIMMRAILAAADDETRRVWLYDSFAGLPKPDVTNYPQDAPDRLWEYNHILSVDLETVRGNFARFDLLDARTQFVRGWFRDTIPCAEVGQISVLRLDGDLYESTWLVLENLYPRVSPDGFVVIDDYALPTCRAAVDDFRAQHAIAAPVTEVDWSGIYWRKEI